MWNCIKNCLREVFPLASFLFIAGLVAGIIGFVSVTGGVGAVLALGATAIAKAIGIIIGGVFIADALATLAGCILYCF